MELVFESFGINWIWYLKVKVNLEDKSVEILQHYRVHKGDSGHPTVTGKGEWKFIETSDRTVTAVYLDIFGNDNRLIYAVSNPKNVFSYN